jgi:hypothetical protein
VNLVVSAGPATVIVPDAVGLTQAAAESAITTAGLTVGTVTLQSSATVPAGNVISQNPLAGVLVSPGTAVNLVVSTGPATVTVPNVVGMAQAAAESSITTAGLTVGTVTLQSSATVPAGNVISQNPLAGANVSPGTAVDLVVSTGPANTAPVVTITNPSNGATFTQIDSIPFAGTATDAEDGPLTASLSWSSSIVGVIGSGGSFTTTLPVGTHTVTASVTDSGGLTGSASITVIINAAAADTLTCKKADYKPQPDSLAIEVQSSDLPKGNRIITGVVDRNGNGFGGADDYGPFNIPVKNPGSDVYRIVIQPFPNPNPTEGASVFKATSDLGGECTITVN